MSQFQLHGILLLTSCRRDVVVKTGSTVYREHYSGTRDNDKRRLPTGMERKVISRKPTLKTLSQMTTARITRISREADKVIKGGVKCRNDIY